MNITDLPSVDSTLPLAEWWSELLAGYGGAIPLSKPEPVECPEIEQDTVLAYWVIPTLENGCITSTPPNDGNGHDNDASMALGKGTVLEPLRGASLIIIQCKGQIFTNMAGLYELYKELTRANFVSSAEAREHLDLAIKAYSYIAAIEESMAPEKRTKWIDDRERDFLLRCVRRFSR